MLFSSMNDLQRAIFAFILGLFFLLIRIYRNEAEGLIKKSLYLFL